MPTVGRARVGLTVGLAILAGVIVLLVRVWMLARYSSSVPFWDAWGAEAGSLYTPWLQNEFKWSNLWEWHNEHRIFFTRALAIGLFTANEMQWDVRVQTFASSALFALMTGLSVYWIRRNTSSPISLILIFLTVLAATLPNGWANSFQGFQSCFYFVLLFALLAIHSAASSGFSLGRGILLALFGISAVFSLGGGVLVTLAVVMVVAVRAWLERATWLRIAMFGMPPLLVAMWATIDARKGDVHPATLAELARALATMLSWPFVSFVGMALWIPAIGVLAHVLRRRVASAADLVFGGLSVWVLLICAAAAWSRAFNFTDVQSRYTDLLIPGFVAQIYFAFRLAELVRGRIGNAALTYGGAVAMTLFSMVGLAYASMAEFRNWREYDFMTRIGASHVRAYLDGDANALNGRQHGYIPYPESAPLAAILDDPVVRSYLPISVASLKVPVVQRSRSCTWRAPSDVSPTSRGEMTCAESDGPINSTAELSVGRLSAVTYWIWGAIGRQRYDPVVFDGAADGSSATSQCAIEKINGLSATSSPVSLAYADVIRLIGWLETQPVGSSRSMLEVMLIDDGGHRYSGRFKGAEVRPESVSVVARPGYDLSGFNVTIDGSVVPLGKYHVLLASVDGARCSPGLTVNILNNSDARLRY